MLSLNLFKAQGRVISICSICMYLFPNLLYFLINLRSGMSTRKSPTSTPCFPCLVKTQIG